MSGFSKSTPTSSSEAKKSSSSIVGNHSLNFKSPDDLEMIKTIGTGTFGRVLLCKSKKPIADVVASSPGTLSESSSKSSIKSKSNNNSSNSFSSKKKSSKVLPHASAASNEGYFALKMLNIRQVIKLKQLQHVKNEKACLLEIDHPFIVQLFWTYHDDTIFTCF